MSLAVQPQVNDFGAAITGVDLSNADEDLVAEIRRIWLNHQVVYFPDQFMSHEQLAAFTLKLGPFGHDPYVAPISEHEHIVEVRRDPAETASPFGGAWHSDWSFQVTPPSATILHAKVVPPVGGDTHYADGFAAFEAMSAGEQSELKELTALHSARRPYSHQGFFASGGDKRSMKILPSDDALDVQEHPLVRTHPESGRDALWVNSVYTVGIKAMPEVESAALLQRLFAFSTQDRFVYRHRWTANMLTIWDNRSVQHCARGGYDGHQRIMHRTTVAGDAPGHHGQSVRIQGNAAN